MFAVDVFLCVWWMCFCVCGECVSVCVVDVFLCLQWMCFCGCVFKCEVDVFLFLCPVAACEGVGFLVWLYLDVLVWDNKSNARLAQMNHSR